MTTDELTQAVLEGSRISDEERAELDIRDTAEVVDYAFADARDPKYHDTYVPWILSGDPRLRPLRIYDADTDEMIYGVRANHPDGRLHCTSILPGTKNTYYENEERTGLAEHWEVRRYYLEDPRTGQRWYSLNCGERAS